MNPNTRYLISAVLSASILLFVGINSDAQAKSYTRSCKANYYVAPTSIRGGATVNLPKFTGKGTVGYFNPNEARRRAKKNLVECVRAHWARRHGSNKPTQCTTTNKVYSYTYTMLEAYLGMRLCAANRGHANIRARVGVLFEGDTGCIGKRNIWQIVLDPNMNFICPTRDEPLH